MAGVALEQSSASVHTPARPIQPALEIAPVPGPPPPSPSPIPAMREKSSNSHRQDQLPKDRGGWVKSTFDCFSSRSKGKEQDW